MAAVAAKAATILGPALISAASIGGKKLLARYGPKFMRKLSSSDAPRRILNYAVNNKSKIKRVGRAVSEVAKHSLDNFETINNNNNNKKNKNNNSTIEHYENDEGYRVRRSGQSLFENNKTRTHNTSSQNISSLTPTTPTTNLTSILKLNSTNNRAENINHSNQKKVHINDTIDIESPQTAQGDVNGFYGKPYNHTIINSSKSNKENNDRSAVIDHLFESFTNSVQFKNHENGLYHAQLNDNENNAKKLIHVLIFALFSLRNELLKDSKKCPFCVIHSKKEVYSTKGYEDQLLSTYYKCIAILTTNRESIAVTLCAHYGINVYLLQKVLNNLKRTYNSKGGTYGYDITLTVLDLYKLRSKKCETIDLFCGVIYGGYAADNQSVILKNYENSLDLTLSIHPDIKTISYIYGTGTSINPKHWCGVFVDISERTFYFYDSLNKQTHIDAFFRVFKKRYYDMEFKQNNFANQSASSFCGLYACRFIKYMLYSDNRVETFDNEFNSKEVGNLDNDMDNTLQHDNVNINDTLSTSFFMFLDKLI